MNDLIELSDRFRRAVQFDNHQAVSQLVSAARDFAAACTWIDLTYTIENRVSRDSISRLKEKLEAMALAAQKSGLNRIVLPLHTDSPFAKFIKDNVIDKNEFAVKYGFRRSEYAKDLKSVGTIDPNIETFLDIGLRRLGAIKSETKYKWDAEIKGLSPA